MNKKFKLTSNTKTTPEGVTLYQIQALRDIDLLTKKGSLGGYIEKEENLSHEGSCWVREDSMVIGDSLIKGCAKVTNSTVINSVIDNNAQLFNCIIKHSCINGNVYMSDCKITDSFLYLYGSQIIRCSFIDICITADYLRLEYCHLNTNDSFILFKNYWSSNRTFLYCINENLWYVGCFVGTGKELIKKAYKDSRLSGREYKHVVKTTKKILKKERKRRGY